ncbi:MAG: hypothetical protein ACREBR_03320, partial [bacterium]
CFGPFMGGRDELIMHVQPQQHHLDQDSVMQEHLNGGRSRQRNNPKCICGMITRKYRSETDNNPGRYFFKCNKCKYFRWEDELQGQNRSRL